jgi:hypothetical protein
MNNRLCKCGCGRYITSANPKVEFIHGHNARKHPKPIPNHHPCECGCGELVASNCRVIFGHCSKQMSVKRSESLKVNWGNNLERKKKQSERMKGDNNFAKRVDVRRKISQSLTGKVCTEEQKNINSKAQLNYWANNPERRKEISIKRKNLWKNDESYKDKMKKSMAAVYNNFEVRNKIGEASKRLWATKEFREKHSGENNPNWQGGISGEPAYPLDWKEELKEIVRKRDGYVCQVCLTHESKLKRKLHVHHIDYNKENCDLDNLISLCHNDHMRTNNPKDREKWQSIFASQ